MAFSRSTMPVRWSDPSRRVASTLPVWKSKWQRLGPGAAVEQRSAALHICPELPCELRSSRESGKACQLPLELREHVGAVGREMRHRALRPNVAEAVHCDGMDLSQHAAHLRIDRVRIGSVERGLQSEHTFPLEPVHDDEAEIDQRLAVVGQQDAWRRHAELAVEQARDHDFLLQLPVQRFGIDLEHEGRRTALELDFEHGADLAHQQLADMRELAAGGDAVDDRLRLHVGNRQNGLECRGHCFSNIALAGLRLRAYRGVATVEFEPTGLRPR